MGSDTIFRYSVRIDSIRIELKCRTPSWLSCLRITWWSVGTQPNPQALELVTRTFNTLIILESLWPLSLHIFLLLYSFSLLLLNFNYMYVRHFYNLNEISLRSHILYLIFSFCSFFVCLFGFFLLICLEVHWLFPFAI